MQHRPLVFIILLSTVASLVFGLSARKPTPEEQKAIDKCERTMIPILNQFRGPDWQEKIDITFHEPMIAPDTVRPMTVGGMFQRTYDVKPTSKRYKTLIAPRLKKVSEEKDSEKSQLMKALTEDLMHVRVQVYINSTGVKLPGGPTEMTDLLVPGAAFAYKIRDNPFSYGTSYVLGFGNWKKATWFPGTNMYGFKFMHAPGTPFIENVEIHIYGADDRIQQLLHTVTWNKVNDALTP